MEHKAPGKASTVSRLPKFGSRPVNTTFSLPSGTVLSRLSCGTKGCGIFTEVASSSSFSVKNGSSSNPPGEKRDNCVFHPPGPQASKKSSTPATTGHRSVLTGRSKPAGKSSRSTSSPKPGSTSPCSATSKPTDVTSGFGPRLQMLRGNLSSSNGLPQSSCVPGRLSSDQIVRSQSFSHFRQLSPAASAVSRSFSFNRAVELAKPLPNTQLCPVRAHGPPQCITSSRLAVGFGKSLTDQSPALAPRSGCSTSPSGLKKPQPSALGFRRSEHPIMGRRILDNPLPESDLDDRQFWKSAPADVADRSEEMSCSSASSERTDTREGPLGDFDQLSELNGVPDNRHLVTATQTQFHNFLDWMVLPGGAVGVSSDAESVGGSSLEPSPSNSGGTYILDEEMMEPLGHNTHSQTSTNTQSHTRTVITHSQYCSSYESILSGPDGENKAVFDLENNLIPATELPEHKALYRGRTFHCEPSDKEEPQQRHNGANHLQNDIWMFALQGFDGSPAVRVLEELTLEEILKDFSSVKSQLLKLEFLLQKEDSEVSSNGYCEVKSSAFQVKELLDEVVTLREQLKNKDKTITQLRNKHQQHVQEKKGSSDLKEIKDQKADKFTQTPWRLPSSLQKLQLSSPRLVRHLTQESSAGSGTIYKYNHHQGPL